MNTLKTLTAVLAFYLFSSISCTVLAEDGAVLFKERTCIACHGEKGKAPVMSEYPVLAGQSDVYLVKQMQDIRSGARSHAHTAPMKNIMHLISDEEMSVIAKWLAKLE